MPNEDQGRLRTIVIAEDQVMMAEGLSAILEKSGDFKVLGISPDGEHLLQTLNNGPRPDVILLDLNMPVMDGFKACKAIREKFPSIVVVVLTMYNTDKILQQVKDSGAAGMLLKYASSSELLGKLREILAQTNGTGFVTTDAIEDHKMDPAIAEVDSFLVRYKVSNRELEIMQMVAQGLQTEEIAQKLFLSTHTVTTHRKNILNKLNLSNAVELILFMQKHQLL